MKNEYSPTMKRSLIDTNILIYYLADAIPQEGLETIEKILKTSFNISIIRKLVPFLIQAKNDGKKIVGYGAPAKGNTLLNYCGIRTDFLNYTVDRSPHKQNKYPPGTHIPIKNPDKIKEDNPDYILILPWNIKMKSWNR